MPKKRYTAEDVIHKLREADVLLAQGTAWAPDGHRGNSPKSECRVTI